MANHPFRTSLAAVSLALLGGLSLAGQSAAPARNWTAPRTPEGRPDLQGIWNYSSLTPVERPAEFANRSTLPLDEARRWAESVQQRNNADRRDGSVDADLARAYNDAWYDRGSGMAIVNGLALTSLVVEPADGRVPALTAEAQQRQAARAQDRRDHPADGPENRSNGERCLSFNAGPPMLPGPYNNYVQVHQFKDHVVIFNEMIHDARVVPTDGRQHLAASLRRFQGDSIGRWEGDTLVIDTTNFTEKSAFRGSGSSLHLVERLTRVAPDTLLYEFTATDAASFTKPWKVALPMSRTDEQIYEYACHEGNHAMEGMLRGARFGEKR